MGRRILIYLILWVVIFAVLCIISLIKYKDVLTAGLDYTFSGIIVTLIVVAGIGIAVFSGLRRY